MSLSMLSQIGNLTVADTPASLMERSSVGLNRQALRAVLMTAESRKLVDCSSWANRILNPAVTDVAAFARCPFLYRENKNKLTIRGFSSSGTLLRYGSLMPVFSLRNSSHNFQWPSYFRLVPGKTDCLINPARSALSFSERTPLSPGVRFRNQG